jgi:hypothetical protein
MESVISLSPDGLHVKWFFTSFNPREWQLQKQLQIWIALEHALDQGDQLGFAAFLQRGFQVIHFREGIWGIYPGEQQGSDVLAAPIDAHRAGACGENDPCRPKGELKLI